ncbi:MAG: alpha/beta-type small acid-soluble spore protein [Terrisporobacter othiniensis]|uniref:Alpha/beta-type small acid-soluble spore protein n=3 Tax=Terrisporobacter TaxID=1505652 RepID=A0AAX2ZNT9_9FIRM|nr:MULTISPECIES: alpha/beta-type small acid-soluble spore protein [Terrisporobacter]MBN9647972.1 alpha/beta-type small acid-soluble spore protein [Terrisporobacter glycolicus]MDU4862194.1 alpha/beta-type small acid-soluble spore protein [Terrisporobacter othiniensis]MCC3866361.1 alpha/beta-type small acid-soluble spore protein [Terrisporobacter petrolearius]MDU6995854.1 alpha/beta-type small acid-soluble spore protein [Terrisporobacter othiniensis]UEL49282.1 alpha/beta-type small acid-soluble 
MSTSNNRQVVPEARAALNQMKLEIAGELGMSNYENIDKGNLTARQNGYVGGYMTKKLVEMAEKQMAGK